MPFDAGWIGVLDHAFLRGLGVTGEDGGFSLMVGVFADPAYFGASHKAGLTAGGGAALLLEQLLANGAVIAYSFVATALIMLALKATIGVRTAEGSDDAGLDAAEHGEHAYVAN